MPEYVTKSGEGTALEERTKEKTEKPRKFRVVLLNDHYTTMEFVVEVLEVVFQKPRREAMRIMLSVHEKGRGVAGIYIKAVAEAKADLVHQLAQEHGFPLKCMVEPEAGGNEPEE